MNLKRGIFIAVILTTLFSIALKIALATRNISASDFEDNLPLKRAMTAGGQLALEACREQFANELWQCPLRAFVNMASGEPATREQAFVNAITSAGITYAITRSCSQGILEDCACSSRQFGAVDAVFTWERCSDDVTYADSVTAKFFRSKMKRDEDASRAQVFWHNHRAGRIAVKRSIKRICNCEGSSVSCANKTCWFRLTNFTVIANRLKKQYRRAFKIEAPVNTNAAETKSSSSENSKEVVVPWNGNIPPFVGLRKLVYIDESPDYCVANETMGWLGARGRQCLEVDVETELTKSTMKPCRQLCRRCGLSIEREVTSLMVACNCKFIWCCRMVCDSCVKEVVRYTCAYGTKDQMNL
ncbi:protein Wnt-8a-like [Macrobrachium nipponense]|uniref:protein Wnt-8a-like n=1 Tax=Macrobrachium nipponense TaxID=159736 RepID=UPI0030C7B201